MRVARAFVVIFAVLAVLAIISSIVLSIATQGDRLGAHPGRRGQRRILRDLRDPGRDRRVRRADPRRGAQPPAVHARQDAHLDDHPDGDRARAPLPVRAEDRALALGDAEPFMLRQRREAEEDRRLAERGAGCRGRPAAGVVVTIGVTGARTTIVEGCWTSCPTSGWCASAGVRTTTCALISPSEFDVTRDPGRSRPVRAGSGTADAQAHLGSDVRGDGASLAVNLTSTVRICEHLLTRNPRARIAVLGSESFRGSFDTTYFLAKAGVNAYVQQRRLPHPGQQLVVVSPTIILDSGMTRRRHDPDRVAERAARAPKQRFLRSAEVSRLLHYVLYVDDGMLTNTVVSLNGGEFAR